MTIDVQRTGDAVTLLCCGRIVVGLEAETLEVMARNQRCLLDFKSIVAIDAHGLGSLVGICLWAREKGVKFALVNTPPAIRELVQLARIDTILPMFVTEDARGKPRNGHGRLRPLAVGAGH